MSEEQLKEPVSEDEAVEKQLEQEDEKLPFPNARVVALLKAQLGPEKMVRARVKKELNEFLGHMVKAIGKEINKSPYSVIEAQDLHRAIKKYQQLEEVAAQKERIMKYLDRIKEDCNVLAADVERTMALEQE